MCLSRFLIPGPHLLSLTPIHFRWRRNIHTGTPVDLSLFCDLLELQNSCMLRLTYSSISDRNENVCLCRHNYVCILFFLCLQKLSTGRNLTLNNISLVTTVQSCYHWSQFEAHLEGCSLSINSNIFRDSASIKESRHFIFYFCALTKQQSRQTEFPKSKYLCMFAVSLSVWVRFPD